MTVYRVYWDNGAHACGTFPQTFATEKEAQQFAEEWAHECNVRDGIDPESEEGYSAEVIEVPK